MYPISVSDSTTTSENINIAIANQISIGDSMVTSEYLDVLDNSTRRLTISDTTVTSEYVDSLRARARNIAVSDTTITSEYLYIYMTTRYLYISDSTVTSESVGYSTVLAPAWIIRTLSFEIVIPSSINFVLIANIPLADFVIAKT